LADTPKGYADLLFGKTFDDFFNLQFCIANAIAAQFD
jgi:hypothetical protein